MNTLFALIALILLSLVVAMGRIFAGRSGRPFDYTVANVVAGTVTSHNAGITRYAEAALANPHVLVKQGTADNEVLINGSSDMPWGYTDDAAAIDETLPVFPLGNSGRTAVLTASGDIVSGEYVYTAAAGQVQDLPVASGTYYLVGIALTAAGDGEEVEVATCIPRETVVS